MTTLLYFCEKTYAVTLWKSIVTLSGYPIMPFIPSVGILSPIKGTVCDLANYSAAKLERAIDIQRGGGFRCPNADITVIIHEQRIST